MSIVMPDATSCALLEPAAPARAREAATAVRELTRDDFARWDEFVATAQGATFFHRAGWKTVIESAFGHRTHFLYVERNDGDGVARIDGVLPLAEMKSLLFGHALVSLPFCAVAGIAAADDEAVEPRAHGGVAEIGGANGHA